MGRAARSALGCFAAVTCIYGMLVIPERASGEPAHVGVVLDGASAFTDSVRAAFQSEIVSYFGEDQAVDFPARHVVTGDWTPEGAAAAIDELLARKGVDMVLALGPVGSNALARRRSVPKPAIAALVIDAPLQKLPLRDGASGVKNLNYINVAYAGLRTVQLFHELVPFRKLAVLIRPGPLDDLPELRARALAIAESLGVSMAFVPVTRSAAGALAVLPPDADAAYLGPAEQLTDSGLDSLIQGLNARRLPTFSFTGRNEIERGALASYAPKDDLVRRARRVAGNLQRILGGEDAGSLPVELATIPQLTLNMATARAIGYSPTWVTLTEAELLHAQPPASGPTWSLASVAGEALKVDLELKSASRTVASGGKDVAMARGALFPQINAQATGTVIREETAAQSFGQQPERQTQGQLSLSVPLFAEQRWANLSVEKHRQTGRVADRRTTELDAVYNATKAYLDVLRAKAIANVERENVKKTRTNLELARLREHTGAASRADVYRWEAELAKGRSRVLETEASVELASLEFNRLLDRPLEEAFQTEDATMLDPSLLTSEPRILDYFATPQTFRVFRDFMVAEGRAASPQLRAVEAASTAAQRSATAARRAFWLPTVSLDGSLSDVFSRDGAGSSLSAFGPLTPSRAPDPSWTLRLQGTLPIFDGLTRNAALDQANIEVQRMSIERKAADLAVSAQIRAALQQAGASWSTIEQARIAARASRSNLDIVTDSYTRGTTSIVTLLDAQQASLSADESAANAVYDFLVDLMGVERAVGQFGFFRTADERESFFRRMDEFYKAAGVAPTHR